MRIQNETDVFRSIVSYAAPSIAPRRPLSEIDRRRNIVRYTNWLHSCAQERKRHEAAYQREVHNYREMVYQHGMARTSKKAMQTFAPFRETHSALHLLSRNQLLLVITLLLIITLGLIF